MPLQGDLDTFSMAAIGRLIHTEKKTGVLKVVSGRHQAEIYFKAGGIVFVHGDLAADMALGRMLVQNRTADPAAIDRALAVARQAGRRLGSVLMEQGVIGANVLKRLLYHQFKEIVTLVLSWQSGTFEYTDGLGDHVADIRLEIDPDRLVADAEQLKSYRRWIPNDRTIFAIKPNTPKNGFVSIEGAAVVMLLIDGRRTVAQIIDESGLSQIMAYKVLAHLIHRGVIGQRPSTAETDNDGPPDHRIAPIGRILIETLAADMAQALGTGKVHHLLSESLHALPDDARPQASDAPRGDDLNHLVDRIGRHLEALNRQAAGAASVGIVSRILRDMLQRHQQLLGEQATGQCAERLRAVLERLAPDAKSRMTAIYQILEAGMDPPAGPAGASQAGSPLSKAAMATRPLHTAAAYSSETIIDFYLETVRHLMRTLQDEMGAKADDVAHTLLAGQQHFDTLFVQLDLGAPPAVGRQQILAQLKRCGADLTATELTGAFQHLVASLLQEQKRLLGERHLRSEIKRLNDYLSRQRDPRRTLLIDGLRSFLHDRHIVLE